MTTKAKIIIGILMLIGAYGQLSWFVFQIRNPTANRYAWLTDTKSVLTWQAMPKYQGQ